MTNAMPTYSMNVRISLTRIWLPVEPNTLRMAISLARCCMKYVDIATSPSSEIMMAMKAKSDTILDVRISCSKRFSICLSTNGGVLSSTSS